jgi:hypothetical protein
VSYTDEQHGCLLSETAVGASARNSLWRHHFRRAYHKSLPVAHPSAGPRCQSRRILLCPACQANERVSHFWGLQVKMKSDTIQAPGHRTV